MLEDAIREVRVKVRTDLPSDAAEIGPAVERVVRAVLGRCAELVEQGAPGRVVLIGRLPLHWRFDELDEFAIAEPAHVEDLARAAADTIERLAIAAPAVATLATGSPVPDVVVFDDEAHLRAAQLLALAHGRREWFDAIARVTDEGDPWAALARPEHRVLAEATLRRLARDGALAGVLAARDTAGVAAVAAMLAIEPVSAIGSIAAKTNVPPGDALAGELAEAASRWPALAPPARHLALRIHAAVLLERELEADDVASLAARAETISRGGARKTENDSARDRPHAHQRAERAAEEPPPEEETGPTFVTGSAGLFYLLARLQELDIPESLWRACLPEGVVLAAAAAALLGPRFEDDPAPALFGGIDRVVPCPEITHEQHAEVARATCAQMAAALPRRGEADIPGAVVTLIDRASGRVLIAAVEGLPFAFFAWPAQTPDLVREGLATLLELWPSNAPLTASPALTTLDASGRLRPWQHPPIITCLVPTASSAPASALLAMVAGAPATLLASRAGNAPLNDVDAFLTRRLAHSARVRVTSDRMDVILSGSAIDLDLRRAALDGDPGWLPWLRRSVRFVFEGLEVLEEP